MTTEKKIPVASWRLPKKVKFGPCYTFISKRSHFLEFYVCDYLLFCLHQDMVHGRASHAAVVLGDFIWVFGGFSLIPEPFQDFVRYEIEVSLAKSKP